jgi:hypothetical protein
VLNKLAIPFAIFALIVIGAMRSSPQESPAVHAYHNEVEMLVNSIPLDIGDWRGEEVLLPTSATSLLRPNALRARRYVNIDRGVSATLMFVQCRDARDMAGHFPPRCYPANGWLEVEDSQSGVVENSGERFARYAYSRVAGKNEREITVYNMFALPSGNPSIDMGDVYQLSADYQYRYFGAAQVQVVIDGSVGQDQHDWILEEIYAIVQPSVEFVRRADSYIAAREGSES